MFVFKHISRCFPRVIFSTGIFPTVSISYHFFGAHTFTLSLPIDAFSNGLSWLKSKFLAHLADTMPTCFHDIDCHRSDRCNCAPAQIMTGIRIDNSNTNKYLIKLCDLDLYFEDNKFMFA